MEALLCALQKNGIKIEKSCALSEHSTFRVGGAALAAAFPDTRERLLTTLSFARDAGVRFSVFGNGSNVVFADEGFDGLVIFTGECRKMKLDGYRIGADCGVQLSKIASFACANSLGGAEFMHGIPGTLGGAVFMNAGAFGGGMEQVTVSSDYWDSETGEIGTLVGEAHRFSHRMSVYAQNPRYILLGATLELYHGDPVAIRAKMDDYMARRRHTQPLAYPSAGSVFKRPVGYYAGKLIEDCGLKGRTVGGAQVSEKHAGFIVNVGGATAKDIGMLVEQIKHTVLQNTGVALECEIRFVDFE